jgi:hypothetical protein
VECTLRFNILQCLVSYQYTVWYFDGILPTFHYYIASSNVRSEVFSTTKAIIRSLRGRYLIFSSGADMMNLIRGPFDVMNIANMMGLTAEQVLDVYNISFCYIFNFSILYFIRQGKQLAPMLSLFFVMESQGGTNIYQSE